MQQTLHRSADLAFHYVEPIIARPRDGFDQSRTLEMLELACQHTTPNTAPLHSQGQIFKQRTLAILYELLT